MAILLSYVPVPHKGWLNLFHQVREECDVKELWLLGHDLIHELTFKYEDIWSLPPATVMSAVKSWKIFDDVRVVERSDLIQLALEIVYLADDDMSHQLADKYLHSPGLNFLPVFLRYDQKNVYSQVPVSYDRVSVDPFDVSMIELAKQEGSKTSDFWRQVGGVLVKDKTVVLNGHNTQMPGEHINHILGDPRNFVEAGTRSELASSIHAEQAVIAEAARQGISLEGSDLYLTVFPCPTCAKLMAIAGIRRCFFSSGAAYLDADRVLHAFGVEIIYVQGC